LRRRDTVCDELRIYQSAKRLLIFSALCFLPKWFAPGLLESAKDSLTGALLGDVQREQAQTARDQSALQRDQNEMKEERRELKQDRKAHDATGFEHDQQELSQAQREQHRDQQA